MSDKKYSPKEAAIMVLKKAEELYKASNLAKGDWAKIHSKLKREGYSEESADKIDGAIKAKLGKGEMKKDAMMGVSPQPTSSPTPTPTPQTINQQIGSPWGKSEDPSNPDAKEDAELGEKVEQDVEQHEEENAGAEEKEAEQKEAPMKGHLKLAKFIGAMEQKRGLRKCY